MSESHSGLIFSDIPTFNKEFLKQSDYFCILGEGRVGGKALGLWEMYNQVVAFNQDNKISTFSFSIPKTVVIGTDYFDEFLKINKLTKVALSNVADSYIAHDFLKASLPEGLVRDLKLIIKNIKNPLAIRSSSISEDVVDKPFAGVFETKMIPNHQSKDEVRFNKLQEAIKLVFSSTFFKTSKDYFISIDREIKNEKMAVIIQECVGNRYGDYFYPEVSGVAKSHNFYPTGTSKASDGVINLAFGLGKTIVDGGISWIYSPESPKAPPPFNSTTELLNNSQTKFWAINMGSPPEYDPIEETEFLSNQDIFDAEGDEVLKYVASTYDTNSDRITIGTAFDGPRVMNFAPMLNSEIIKINDAIKSIVKLCEKKIDSPVEIEFAVTLDLSNRSCAVFHLLQMRKMSLSNETVVITEQEL